MDECTHNANEEFTRERNLKKMWYEWMLRNANYVVLVRIQIHWKHKIVCALVTFPYGTNTGIQCPILNEGNNIAFLFCFI